MRWCFDAGRDAYADGVLHRLETIDGLALVPVLWRYEVSSVLARAQLNGQLAADEVAEFLDDLRLLDIVVDMPGAERIMTDGYRLATTYRLTSYDATYLELALRRNLPLATLDNALIRACGAAGGSIL